MALSALSSLERSGEVTLAPECIGQDTGFADVLQYIVGSTANSLKVQEFGGTTSI